MRRFLTRADVIHARPAQSSVPTERQNTRPSRERRDSLAVTGSLEFSALTASNDTIDDFREGHDRAYDRGADLHLVTDETARRMKQLYRDNRAAAYYRDTVASAQEADAMFDLAVVVHNYVKNFAQHSHECRCQH